MPGAEQRLYNQIAAQSLERIAALSDGVFAIAMTLLVLDLHVPTRVVGHGELELLRALVALSPRLLAYLMSFMTLGIFWAGQQTQLHHFSKTNRDLTWIHFVFLCVVSLMPFSTAFLAEYMTFRTALVLYWFNILLLGVVLYWSWKYACKAGLLKEEVTLEIQCAVERRILVAQAFYLLGAALCVFNTYVSIAFILLVQLQFAIAPKRSWFSRF
jgi:uncharacterized membrane protein